MKVLASDAELYVKHFLFLFCTHHYSTLLGLCGPGHICKATAFTTQVSSPCALLLGLERQGVGGREYWGGGVGMVAVKGIAGVVCLCHTFTC
jgi:hypothetical protein